ncbi:2-methylcitrate dehydratase PrpD [Tistlia consotensis]|uniref:2-methylcitrate dehydratase PrpD n=1 Tax=Tistlia consotensis USBA 355 TaxID=560819 RepID=A0A1Y6B882_9PROT|nr:MmgE/PrpD family protein [Tistlia consotensis]SME98051.1 2-methylcitrate dehydratase PrpD [Tistlia consotensis USBA 355]SNR57450.1 2-methylcitrate dehydratase PrpD [Tistlia consotensis]
MARPTVAGGLARFLAGFAADALPDPARAAARRCLFDLVAAAAAGAGGAAARSVRGLALARGGPGGVWFAAGGGPPELAAMANATAASALDIDDGHRAAAGHPGAAVIPAALAAAEREGSSAGQLLTAVVLGYEVAVRIAAARDFGRLYALSSGRWSGYGVVAAAGWLRGTPAPALAQALAMAGELSPWLVGSGYGGDMGNQVKEGIPWTVQGGLVALELAERGFTGPLDLLDHPEHYDGAAILRGLGESFAIEGTYFKPYACCRWIHSALDGLLAILAEEAVEPGRIEAIRVRCVRRAATLTNSADPDCVENAQYSFPYCLALAALGGARALLPLREESLHRPEVVALARRVELEVDPELDAAFPARCPAEVELLAGGRRLTRRVDLALGDPGNPLGERAHLRKFLALTVPALGAAPAKRLARAVLGLGRGGEPAELLAALRAPLAG